MILHNKTFSMTALSLKSLALRTKMARLKVKTKVTTLHRLSYWWANSDRHLLG